MDSLETRAKTGNKKTGPKILVADDDKDFLESIRERAEKDFPDCEFVYVPNGEVALREYSEGNPKPEILVLDMMMPKRSGFMVLERIKRESLKAPPRVIMVTINQGSRHKTYAQIMGVDNYFIKEYRTCGRVNPRFLEQLFGAIGRYVDEAMERREKK